MNQEILIQNTEKLTLGGILAGIYLFSVPIFSYSEKLGLSEIPQLIGLVLVLYAVYDLLKTKTIIRSRFSLFFLLFTLWCIIGYFYSAHQSETKLLLSLIKVSVIAVCVTQLIKTRIDFFSSIFIFFTSVFFAVYLNLSELAAYNQSNDISDAERFAGSFENANTAAIYFLAILWGGAAILLGGRFGKKFNLIIIPGLILAAVVIIYTGSRKGLIGLVLFALVMSWIMLKKLGTTYFRRILLGLLLILLLFLLFRFLYTSPYFYRLQGLFEGEASVNERSDLFKQAITIWTSSIKNLFFGIGINNFMYYNEYFAYSHSTISETLVSSGLIGFSLYFAGLFAAFSQYISLYRDKSYPDKNQMIIFVFMLIITLFINTTAVMYDDRLYLPLLGLIGSYGLFLKKEFQDQH